MTEKGGHSIFTRHFLSGALSNLLLVSIRVPLEAIKCRQQICTERLLPTYHLLRILWRDRRLYTGTSMILLRDLIPGGLYSAVFFASRQHLESYSGLVNPMISKFALGGMMGAVYWFLAYPFDMIRNVQQSSESKAQASIGNAFKAIIKTYGIKGLYRGAGVTIAKTLLSSGISLSLFDTFLKILDVDFN